MFNFSICREGRQSMSNSISFYYLSEASRSRIYGTFADYVERKMHRSPRRQSPRAEPCRKRTKRGEGAERPSKGGESVRTTAPLFSSCLRCPSLYPRSVHSTVRVDGPFEPNCFASPTYEGHSRAPKCSYFLASLFRAIVHNAMATRLWGKRGETVPNRSSPPRTIEDAEGHGNSSDGFYARSINLEEFYRKSDEVRLSTP